MIVGEKNVYNMEAEVVLQRIMKSMVKQEIKCYGKAMKVF
jgi:hypothetical protein